MTQERDKLATLLFPEGGGAELMNFKLHRSSGEAVSEQFIRDEIHSALTQAWVTRQAKTTNQFRRSGATSVNIAEMVERI
ncbi:hypothetical protein [Brevundimonas sp. DC300-4]|uniref:hypothetical protein n=1 Tax=Brevundimonas sp. DC300-4 TaxID=2804594 RepID=UPI003CFA46BD